MELYPPVRARPVTTISIFAGINREDAFTINAGEATVTKNLTSAKYPALTVKPGFSLLGSAIGTRVLGLGVWKDTELHAIFNDGTWRKWTGTAWSSALKSGLSTTAEWSFCNFMGNLAGINLIAANGVDPIQRYDGSTVQALTGAPTGGNYIEQHDNRLYCAVGNELHFSPLRIADDWTTVNGDDADPGVIVVETNDGETICGLKAGSGHVIIFKPSTMHELYGTSASDYRLIPAAEDIGILNNKCCVNLNAITYFVDDTGIYRYNGGSRPDDTFAVRVRGYIRGMNPSARNTACIGTDGNRLYVAIPVTSSSAPDTVLEFDPTNNTWYVWEDVAPVFMAKKGSNWYMGDASGRVLQIGGTTAAGTAITWNWVSKPFSARSLAQRIRWYRAFFAGVVPEGSTLQVYLSKSASGDDDWLLARSINADGVISSSRVGIPTTMIPNAQWIRVKFQGTGPVDILEFTFEQDVKPLV